MYIMFTYDDNYVGKQTSSSHEDAVHICILFCTKRTPGQKDSCCTNVCAFLSMLMRVKRRMSNKADGVLQNGMKNKRLFLKLAFKTCL